MTPDPAAAGPAEPGAAPAAPPTRAEEAKQAFMAGLQRHAAGDADGAFACYCRAVELHPAFPDAYNNLAVVLKGAKKLPAAAACLRRALIHAPNAGALHSNLGNLLWMMLRFDEAAVAFRRAIELEPSRPEVWHNYGLLLFSMGDLRGAIECFDRAIPIMGDATLVRWDRSLALLMSGDLERGFAEYENRLALKTAPRSPYTMPVWQGEDIAGRTLFVHAEQGFGDTLQFIRYLPLVAARGARVVFGCQTELQRLVRGFPGIAELVSNGAQGPAADFRVPLMSLPHRLGTTLATIPAVVPYLATAPGVAGPPVPRPPGTRLAIGIAWAGNPTQENDHNRSATLEDFLMLCDVPGVALYSLQKGPRVADIAALGARPLVHDLGSQINDFADTAAALTRLDLVIGVDTAIVHLAGAMGRPVWALLPHTPDWRWMRGREDSPWYPSLRLLRQATPGGWDAVMARARAALAALLAGR